MTADLLGDLDVRHFLTWTALAVAAIVAIGIAPTIALAGSEAVSAMLAGCAIAWVGSIVGAIALKAALGGGPGSVPNAALLATAVRLAAIVIVGAAVVLTDIFAVRPLLLWTALGHLGLLFADTAWTLKTLRSLTGSEDS